MKRTFFSFIFLFASLCVSYGQERYLELGNALLNKGDVRAAEMIFREGVAAEPDNLTLQCQLGFALIQMERYSEADVVLGSVLQKDSLHIGANWYYGISSFKNDNDRRAIQHFERILPLISKQSGQYFAANWYVGKAYSMLLKTEGLTYSETDRMFECYEEYLRLQPDANDVQSIREYVDRKRARRPGTNVMKWIDL